MGVGARDWRPCDLSQAGFDGDLDTRTIRPGERRASADEPTEEVPA